MAHHYAGGSVVRTSIFGL